MPTIEEIARRAKVSKTTVSFVINNRQGPSAETIAHVRQVMKELNYVPSHFARGFAARKSTTIGLIVLPYPRVFSDRHHGEALDAVYDTLDQVGYSLLLHTSSHRFVEERRHLTMLMSGQVDGLLLLEPTLDQDYLQELAGQQKPVVLINSDGSSLQIDYVRTDDEMVGRIAAEHLLELGHRNIGFIAAGNNHASARDRATGFEKALEEQGVAFSPAHVFHGAFYTSYWSGYRGCEQILQAHPEVTALFCANDTMAFGAMDAARNLGRQAPRDLSILGVDDNPTSAHTNPPLTTVRQPGYDVARRATQVLLDRLSGSSELGPDPVAEKLPPTIVVRQSCAKCTG